MPPSSLPWRFYVDAIVLAVYLPLVTYGIAMIVRHRHAPFIAKRSPGLAILQAIYHVVTITTVIGQDLVLLAGGEFPCPLLLFASNFHIPWSIVPTIMKNAYTVLTYFPHLRTERNKVIFQVRWQVTVIVALTLLWMAFSTVQLYYWPAWRDMGERVCYYQEQYFFYWTVVVLWPLVIITNRHMAKVNDVWQLGTENKSLRIGSLMEIANLCLSTLQYDSYLWDREWFDRTFFPVAFLRIGIMILIQYWLVSKAVMMRHARPQEASTSSSGDNSIETSLISSNVMSYNGSQLTRVRGGGGGGGGGLMGAKIHPYREGDSEDDDLIVPPNPTAALPPPSPKSAKSVPFASPSLQFMLQCPPLFQLLSLYAQRALCAEMVMFLDDIQRVKEFLSIQQRREVKRAQHVESTVAFLGLPGSRPLPASVSVFVSEIDGGGGDTYAGTVVDGDTGTDIRRPSNSQLRPWGSPTIGALACATPTGSPITLSLRPGESIPSSPLLRISELSLPPPSPPTLPITAPATRSLAPPPSGPTIDVQMAVLRPPAPTLPSHQAEVVTSIQAESTLLSHIAVPLASPELQLACLQLLYYLNSRYLRRNALYELNVSAAMATKMRLLIDRAVALLGKATLTLDADAEMPSITRVSSLPTNMASVPTSTSTQAFSDLSPAAAAAAALTSPEQLVSALESSALEPIAPRLSSESKRATNKAMLALARTWQLKQSAAAMLHDHDALPPRSQNQPSPGAWPQLPASCLQPVYELSVVMAGDASAAAAAPTTAASSVPPSTPPSAPSAAAISALLVDLVSVMSSVEREIVHLVQVNLFDAFRQSKQYSKLWNHARRDWLDQTRPDA